MKMIDRDAILPEIARIQAEPGDPVEKVGRILMVITGAEECVVRCRDCTWYRAEFGKCVNPKCGKSFYGCPVMETHYCGYGERRNHE